MALADQLALRNVHAVLEVLKPRRPRARLLRRLCACVVKHPHCVAVYVTRRICCMIEKTRHEIPADHPIRTFFRQLTERGMGQLNLHDPDTIQYITNLLTEFVQIENQYRFKDESGRRVEYLFEMLTECSREMSPT